MLTVKKNIIPDIVLGLWLCLASAFAQEDGDISRIKSLLPSPDADSLPAVTVDTSASVPEADSVTVPQKVSAPQKASGPAPQADKTVLVYIMDVFNAKKSIAEKLTEKVFLEMTSQPGLRVNYIRNEAAIKENMLTRGDILTRGMDCGQVECAADISTSLGYDYSLIGSVTRQGAGYEMEMRVVDSKTLSVVYSKKETFRQGKTEVMRALPTWGARIARQMAAPGFPEDFSKDGDGKDKKEQGWTSEFFDPHTSHLQGTRIAGTITDTLKAASSPYIITGNLTIPSGVTLVIEPGVKIFVGGEYTTITVMGQLLARGLESAPIFIMSGKRTTAAWDWDRIYFRSKQRSVLEYVHIMNSNYGIVADNSAVTLSHCVLQKNSVRGVYAENSDVEIRDTKISQGHLIAVQVGEYSDVIIERSTITGNHNGISVLDYGTLTLRQTRVEDNERGLILVDSVSLTLDNAQITGNRIGVASNIRISKELFEGLKGNQQNLEPIQKEKVAALIERPAAVKEKRKIEKELKKRAEKAPREFKGGVVSIEPEKQKGYSLIGNVALGSEFHYPISPVNTGNQNIIDGADTIRPGQEISQDIVIPGYYQTLSGFTTIEAGRYSLDASADVRWDGWGGAQLDALSLKTVMGPQQFGLGDFNENGSEISISSLPVRGVKYGAGFFKNRKGDERLKIMGMMGESERPYDEGDRVLGSYNEYKGPGSAVAQRVVGLLRLSVMPMSNWNMNLNYIHSNDLRDAILRPDLSQTAVVTQVPLKSNLAGIENRLRFLDDNVTITAELNVGTVDSLTQAYNLAIEEVLNDNGITGMSEQSALAAILQPTASGGFIDSNIILAMNLDLFTEGLDSATLADSIALKQALRSELDHLRADVESREPGRQEELDESKTMGLRWDSQGIAGRLGAIMNLGKTAVDLSYTYIGHDYFTGGNAYLVKDQRKYELALSRDLSKKLHLNTNFSLSVENASSSGRYLNLLGLGEGSDFGLLADDGFQARQEKKDVLRPKFTHHWDFDIRYDVLDNVELDFETGMDYRLQDKTDELGGNDGDTLIIFADPYFDAGSGPTVPMRYNNEDLDRNLERIRQFWDDTTRGSVLANMLQDREVRSWFGLKSKVRVSRAVNVTAGGKWKWRNDFSSYKNTDLLDKYSGLSDETFLKLGYYPEGEDEFSQDYSLGLSLSAWDMTNKIDYKFGLKSKVKYDLDETNWSLRNSFKWKVIPRKLRLDVKGSIRKRIAIEDDSRFYVLDDQGRKRFFYTRTLDTTVQLVNDVVNALVVGPSEPVELIDSVHEESWRSTVHENEYNYEVTARYNFSTRFYTETTFGQVWYLRPDQLDQQYEDVWGKVELFYSF